MSLDLKKLLYKSYKEEVNFNAGNKYAIINMNLDMEPIDVNIKFHSSLEYNQIFNSIELSFKLGRYINYPIITKKIIQNDSEIQDDNLIEVIPYTSEIGIALVVSFSEDFKGTIIREIISGEVEDLDIFNIFNVEEGWPFFPQEQGFNNESLEVEIKNTPSVTFIDSSAMLKLGGKGGTHLADSEKIGITSTTIGLSDKYDEAGILIDTLYGKPSIVLGLDDYETIQDLNDGADEESPIIDNTNITLSPGSIRMETGKVDISAFDISIKGNLRAQKAFLEKIETSLLETTKANIEYLDASKEIKTPLLKVSGEGSTAELPGIKANQNEVTINAPNFIIETSNEVEIANLKSNNFNSISINTQSIKSGDVNVENNLNIGDTTKLNKTHLDLNGKITLDTSSEATILIKDSSSNSTTIKGNEITVNNLDGNQVETNSVLIKNSNIKLNTDGLTLDNKDLQEVNKVTSVSLEVQNLTSSVSAILRNLTVNGTSDFKGDITLAVGKIINSNTIQGLNKLNKIDLTDSLKLISEDIEIGKEDQGIHIDSESIDINGNEININAGLIDIGSSSREINLGNRNQPDQIVNVYGKLVLQNGSIDSFDVEKLSVQDKVIKLANSDNPTNDTADGAGIEIPLNNKDLVEFKWNKEDNAFVSNNDIIVNSGGVKKSLSLTFESLKDHILNKANPHGVTADMLGVGSFEGLQPSKLKVKGLHNPINIKIGSQTLPFDGTENLTFPLSDFVPVTRKISGLSLNKDISSVELIGNLPKATITSDGIMSSTDKVNLERLSNLDISNELLEDLKSIIEQIGETNIIDALEAKEDIKNKVQTVSANSTEEQYPSAKAVWNIKSSLDTLINNKVDKVSGKGLSANDFTNALKSKLDGIEAGAQKNTVFSVNGKTGNIIIDASTLGVVTTEFFESLIGAKNGLATLDFDGKVPSSQLPSYVDDVLEFASLEVFPIKGEAGKIYVSLDTNKTYRYSGTQYVEISASLALGETAQTAFRGDLGKIAHTHAISKGNPHGTTKADIGLEKVENKNTQEILSSITKDHIPTIPTTKVEGLDSTLNSKENISNKATSISAVNENNSSQYPTVKAVVDYVESNKYTLPQATSTIMGGVKAISKTTSHTEEVAIDATTGKLYSKVSVGPQGPQGVMGPMPKHNWSGTKLQFQNPDGTFGNLVELKGPKGDKGDKPSHRWNGTKLQFENPDGTFGNLVELRGPKGDKPSHRWDGTKLSFQNPQGAYETYVDLKGQRGETGPQGPAPAHKWSGTKLQFQNPNGTFGNLVDLKGERGETGPQGPAPAHKWSGTSLMFYNANGSEGTYVNLRAPGIYLKESTSVSPVLNDLRITPSYDLERYSESNSWVSTGMNIKGPQGLQGPKGDKGDKPSHRWDGTKLQFQNPDGTFGDLVDLKGERGETGPRGLPGSDANVTFTNVKNALSSGTSEVYTEKFKTKYLYIDDNIQVNGYINFISDERLKDKIKTINNQEIYSGLRNTDIWEYKFKDSDSVRIGLMAQDLQRNFSSISDMITTEKTPDHTKTQYKDIDKLVMINQDSLTFVLWSALQEAANKIELLEKEIEKQKDLEQRLLELEKKLK